MIAPDQKVLVTGATGFLGGAVARDLSGLGFKVAGTGRNRSAGRDLEADGIAFHPCDLALEPGALARLAAGCDVVVHCAALSSPWGRRKDFVAANVTATAHVVAACGGSAVRRLVHISSPSVLSHPGNRHDLSESTPWTTPPANHYAATKRESEVIALQAAREVGTVVLRPKALFGPGDTALLPRAIRVARRGTFPLLGGGDPLLDLTWIGDAVRAVRLAIGAPDGCAGRVYHVTSGDPQPRSRVFRALFEACGLDVRYRRVSLDRALTVAGALEAMSRVFTLGRWEPPFTRYTVGALGFGQTLDISAARTDLGFSPETDVLDRLRETGARWREANASPAGEERPARSPDGGASR